MAKIWLVAFCTVASLSACSTPSMMATYAPACSIQMSTVPAPAGVGVVVKLLSQAEAMTLLERTQAQVGAPIDSVYLNNVRAVLRQPDGGSATVLVPYGMVLIPGDRVAYQSSYRNAALPCSYVPNLITGKV